MTIRGERMQEGWHATYHPDQLFEHCSWPHGRRKCDTSPTAHGVCVFGKQIWLVKGVRHGGTFIPRQKVCSAFLNMHGLVDAGAMWFTCHLVPNSIVALVTAFWTND